MSKRIRGLFPMIASHPHTTYLDSASTSLTPQSVIDELNTYYQEHNTNTSRGVDRLLYETTSIFEDVRRKVQSFMHASSEEEIIFTRGTTDALNTAAFGLRNEIQAGDEIILNIAEHHANIIPWQQVAMERKAVIRYVDIDESGAINLKILQGMLNNKTKIVAFAHITNVMGSFNDPRKVAEIVREKAPHAYIIVDGAQGIVQEKVDVQNFDCDLYAWSGHKLFGPTGIGVLYGKQDVLQKMQPLTFGGDMNFTVSKFKSDFKEAPQKFEAGTMMIAEVFGLGAAIDFMKELGYEQKAQHIATLRNYAIEALKNAPHVILYNPNCTHSTTLAFNIKDVPAHDAASMFSNNDVVIRAGHHCAQLLLEFFDAPSSLRASFSIYNTKEDVDAFIHVINLLAEKGAFLDVLF